MAYINQLKTAQGYVPHTGAQLAYAHPEEQAKDPFNGYLAFSLLSTQELADRENDGEQELPEPDKTCTLVALGACMEQGERYYAQDGTALASPESAQVIEMGWYPAIDALLAFAQLNGPLFGTDSGYEELRGWGRAAETAMLATRMQECVNGRKAIGSLKSLSRQIFDGQKSLLLPRISKNRFTSMDGPSAASFTICSTDIIPEPPYDTCFGRLPVVQRVGKRPSGYLYAFAQWLPLTPEELAIFEEEPSFRREHTTVEFSVVCLPHEISAVEFKVLVDALRLSPELEELAKTELHIAEDGEGNDAEGGGALLSREASYSYEQDELAKTDLDILSALVRVMILAHLGGARIDPFQNNEATGNHAFDTLLSWLWYDFSASLSRVKIGYCEKCGRPFSLVGHRGKERLFCSAQCKTSAKNERTLRARDAARNLFDDNPRATLSDMALAAHDKDTATARQRVQRDLSSWPQLKNEVESDIERNGFAGALIFKRCMALELDGNQLLKKERLKQVDNTVRRLFSQSTSAEDLAQKALFDDSAGSVALVRTSLESWPALKQLLTANGDEHTREHLLALCQRFGLSEQRLLGSGNKTAR